MCMKEAKYYERREELFVKFEKQIKILEELGHKYLKIDYNIRDERDFELSEDGSKLIMEGKGIYAGYRQVFRVVVSEEEIRIEDFERNIDYAYGDLKIVRHSFEWKETEFYHYPAHDYNEFEMSRDTVEECLEKLKKNVFVI